MTDETLRPESFRDPFGIWMATQRARYPGSEELIPQMMFAQHRLLHAAYHDAAKLKWPCSGLKFQAKDDGAPTTPASCKRIGCPTCWYRRRCQLFGVLEKTVAKAFYVKTIESRWDRPIDPQLRKSFKEDWTGMVMIGNMVAVDVADDGCDWQEGRTTPMPVYRLVGVFASDKRIRPRRSVAHPSDPTKFRVEVDNDAERYATCGVDYQEYGSAAEVMDDWVVLDPYPYKIAETEEYGDVLTTINLQFSRSGRVNSKQAKKYVKATQVESEQPDPGASVSE